MKYFLSALSLTVIFSLTACTKEESKLQEEPTYSGKIEVLVGNDQVASEEYTFLLKDIPVSSKKFHRFNTVANGALVATFRVFWPTNHMMEELDLLSSEKISERIQVDISLSVSKRSDFLLVKKDDRYCLLKPGSTVKESWEYFGFSADNDEDAVYFALQYLSRFVVPLQIGNTLDELEQLKLQNLEKGCNSPAVTFGKRDG